MSPSKIPCAFPSLCLLVTLTCACDDPAPGGDPRSSRVYMGELCSEVPDVEGARLDLDPLPRWDASVPPWEPPTDCVELAADLLDGMTLAEKIGQMTQPDTSALDSVEDVVTYNLGSVLSGGGTVPPGGPTPENWASYADELHAAALGSRLGIPLLYALDAVHGQDKATGAVVFPHNVGLGCTFDPELVRAVAEVTAREVAGSGIDWTFAPVVAAARDERWGRTYEAFGEAAWQAGALGRAAVLGLQGEDPRQTDHPVLACAKHFAGDGATSFGTSPLNDGLIDRGDVELTEEEFRAVAVEQYRPLIAAGVGSIMVSYSSYQGELMHGHARLLTDVLKGELGFAGFLISDWDAIQELEGVQADKIGTAINAGLDVIMMSTGVALFQRTLTELVDDGRVPLSRVDDAVRRVLTTKCALGLFESGYTGETDPALTETVGSDAHRALAREAVSRSVVLMQNRGGVLPLSPDTKIHVVGDVADDLGPQSGGWTINWDGSDASETTGTTILQALRNGATEENVTYSASAWASVPGGTEAIVLVLGFRPYAEWQGDREDLALDVDQLYQIDDLRDTGLPLVVVLLSGRPRIITSHMCKADAWLAAWYPGTEGDGVADVIFGDHPPSGRLSHTWPRDLEQIPINEGDEDYDPLFPLGFGLTYE